MPITKKMTEVMKIIFNDIKKIFSHTGEDIVHDEVLLLEFFSIGVVDSMSLVVTKGEFDDGCSVGFNLLSGASSVQ
jgi:hypothetical protein